MILANLSQPLLGLVDTAVLGHLGDTQLLAGAAVGAFLLSQIIWLLGFLRMSITGLAAQQFGSRCAKLVTAQSTGWFDDLGRGLISALILGIGLYLLSGPLLQLMMQLTQLPNLAQDSMQTYFSIRIANAPVMLFNLVLIGWLVGHQRARQVMWIQILGNILNIVLNLILVFAFDLAVAGLAYATVLSEWAMCLASLWVVYHYVFAHTSRGVLLSQGWCKIAAFYRMLSLNRDLFLRSVFLQGCLAFVTYQGARYGVESAAVNALLMQFFVIIALGLDGIANAIEALVGEAEGQQDTVQQRQNILASLLWSSIMAVGFSVTFALGFDQILGLLTNQTSLIELAQPYYWIIVALPLLAHWCYCFDGIYIGLTRAKVMRNSMFISAVVGFLGVFWLFQDWQNMGLWLALLALQTMRGVTLGIHLWVTTTD